MYSLFLIFINDNLKWKWKLINDDFETDLGILFFCFVLLSKMTTSRKLKIFEKRKNVWINELNEKQSQTKEKSINDQFLNNFNFFIVRNEKENYLALILFIFLDHVAKTYISLSLSLFFSLDLYAFNARVERLM